jgi:hypothetical protein
VRAADNMATRTGQPIKLSPFSLVPTLKGCGKEDILTHPSVISELDGGWPKLSASCPDFFTPQGKIRQYPLDRKLGWFGILFDHCREKNKSLASAWPNTLGSSRPVRRLVSLPTALAHIYSQKDVKLLLRGSHVCVAETSSLLGCAPYQLV